MLVCCPLCNTFWGMGMKEVGALSKGLQILDQLLEASDAEKQGVSVTEVATVLGVNKSSASRLFQTLAKRGYVERDTVSRGYVLGPKMRSVVQIGPKTALRDLARPFLYQLMKRTGECAHTAVYSQGKALIIDDVESAASLRVSGVVGRLEELHCTAVGKSLLAFIDAPIPEVLPYRTEQTFTCKAEFEKHLELIRQQGYALDDEENFEGVRCLAAPVFDKSGAAIACIGISGPTVRMTREKINDFAATLLDTSKELSHILAV